MLPGIANRSSCFFTVVPDPLFMPVSDTLLLISILQMRKLKHREVKGLAPSLWLFGDRADSLWLTPGEAGSWPDLELDSQSLSRVSRFLGVEVLALPVLFEDSRSSLGKKHGGFKPNTPEFTIPVHLSELLDPTLMLPL